MPRRGHVHHHRRPLGPVPGREHLHARADQLVGHRTVRAGQGGSHPWPEAEIGEARDDPAGRRLLVNGDLAADVDAEAGHRGRPHSGADRRPPPAVPAAHSPHPPRRRWRTTPARARRSCRTARTAPPPDRRAANAGTASGTHRSPGRSASPPARRGAPGPPVRTDRRRTPRTPPSRPIRPRTRCTAPSTSSTLSIVSSRDRDSSTDVSSAAGAQRRAGVAQRLQRLPDRALRREADGGEVVPDGLILRAGQQDHLRAFDAAPGPSHLLVVRDRRRRRAEVDDEAEIGLVESHAQRRRGDQGLDLVVNQVVLGGEPFGLLGLTGVRRDGITRSRR